MIFYFTATGNSLMAAKALAKEGEALVDMAAARKQGDFRYLLPEGERLGFVFPVYFYTIGDVVSDFLERLEIDGDPYTFAVITCGGGIGGAGGLLAKKLRARGLNLSYIASLLMPDDTVFYYNLASDEANARRLRGAETRLEEIGKALNEKQTSKAKGGLSALCRSLYHAAASTKKFRAEENCLHCGLCERICPDGAIELRDGLPVWMKSKCTKCSACINRCPAEAIQYGKGTKTRRRYVNPILKGKG